MTRSRSALHARSVSPAHPAPRRHRPLRRRRVCSSWRAAADSEALWAALLRRDFPTADEATLAVLLERGRGGRHRCVAREAYRWLAAQWACERCGQAFSDGANSPSACTFHPGILFSGGLMNGEALRYTCCNRRAHRVANGSRDGNGCAAAFHCGGQSAWQRHGAVRGAWGGVFVGLAGPAA